MLLPPSPALAGAPRGSSALLVTLLALAPACGRTSLLDPAITPEGARDAGVADARSAPDAARVDATSPGDSGARDAAAAPDAGTPLGGCHLDGVEIWASSVGPNQRAHARVLGAVAHEGGWFVIVSDLTGEDRLVSTDPEGVVREVSDLEVYGQPVQAFVEGDALFLFHGTAADRHDLGATGIVRTYDGVLVGASLGGASFEGILAVQRLSADAGGGFGVLSLHYQTTTLMALLRYTELRPDAREPAGMTAASGTLEPIPGLDVTRGRYFLDGDHLRVFVRGGGWRVLDVQLGLGALGEPGAMVGVRVESDVTWEAGPELVLAMTRDRARVLTARPDPVTSEYLGYLERLPPTGEGPGPLGEGLRLGYGSFAHAMLDDERRVVVATSEALSVLRRDGGARIGEAIPLTAAVNVPLVLSRRGEQVAVAFVMSGTEERSVGLRCATLPSVRP